jgi:hypothetical protein
LGATDEQDFYFLDGMTTGFGVTVVAPSTDSTSPHGEVSDKLSPAHEVRPWAKAMAAMAAMMTMSFIMFNLYNVYKLWCVIIPEKYHERTLA